MAFTFATPFIRYIGTSSDVKPTDGSVPAGAGFHETDTGVDWIYNGAGQWSSLPLGFTPAPDELRAESLRMLKVIASILCEGLNVDAEQYEELTDHLDRSVT